MIVSLRLEAAVLAKVWLYTGSIQTETIALIWPAHIGMDRARDYGPKFFAGLGHTHLGMIGRTNT